MSNKFEVAIDGMEQEINDHIRKIAIDLDSHIVKRTPVGNPSLWKNQKSAASAVANGYVGGTARGRWSFALNKSNGMYSAIISNNLDYIERLEDGHSTQAPTGMVDLSLTIIEKKYK